MQDRIAIWIWTSGLILLEPGSRLTFSRLTLYGFSAIIYSLLQIFAWTSDLQWLSTTERQKKRAVRVATGHACEKSWHIDWEVQLFCQEQTLYDVEWTAHQSDFTTEGHRFKPPIGKTCWESFCNMGLLSQIQLRGLTYCVSVCKLSHPTVAVSLLPWYCSQSTHSAKLSAL